MNTIRITLAAFALASLGVAQASEITEFPLGKSIKSRAEVQAEASTVHRGPSELYDGSHLQTPSMAAPKSREQVRMEARDSMLTAAMKNDLVGGM